jgi:predicted sulfurtransferase
MNERFLLARETVRVIFHLDGGYTKVVWEMSENTAWGGTGWIFDIPTHVIPHDLRIIGSCFLLSIVKSNANDWENIEDIRNNRNSFFNIEKLTL